MTVVHIYKLPQVVQVTHDIGAFNTMNYPVNSTDIKIFRSVRTTLTFRIRDIDRKPVPSSDGHRVLFTLSDRHRGGVAFSRYLTEVNPAKATYELAFEASDAAGLEIGSYAYALVSEDADGVFHPLYTDRDQSMRGVAIVSDGPFFQTPPSLQINGEQFLQASHNRFVTGAFAGAAGIGDASGSHQLAIYADGFTGTLVIQGSLDLSPGTGDADWFEIERVALPSGLPGALPLAFIGNLMWVRFVLEPATPIGGLDGFEKILYRN
jgi:hypothetical protein